MIGVTNKTCGRSWTIAVVTLTLAGCGGSLSTSTAGHGQTSAPSGAAAIESRTLTNTEFPGFAPAGAPVREHSAKDWVTAQQTPSNEAVKDAARLRRLGFVAAARENLANGSAAGLSLVEQFRTAGAARAELTNQAREFKRTVPRRAYSSFQVTGIPGALGFGASGGGDTGINVAFADGSYYYLVGAGWHTGNASPTSRAALIAAATNLYRRVHG